MAKYMADMTDPELRRYMDSILRTLRLVTPPDVRGVMVTMHCGDGISHFISDMVPEDVEASIRQLKARFDADDVRIEGPS